MSGTVHVFGVVFDWPHAETDNAPTNTIATEIHLRIATSSEATPLSVLNPGGG
jgi:hypothetical protein